MAAYGRVYDSRHLQSGCREPDQLRNRTLGNRVWATFTFAFTHFSGPQAGNEMGVFFGKKSGKWGVFCKKS